jgi:signal transduction histidine kinase
MLTQEKINFRLDLLIITIYSRGSINYLFILKDITQNHIFNEIILQNANNTKAVSFVSHEMRTPLNCIIGMLNMIEPLLEAKDVEEFVLPALGSARFLLNLLNDLLDVAQIHAGTFKLVLLEFDLKKLMLEIVCMFEIQAKVRCII